MCENPFPLVAFPVIAIHNSLTGNSHSSERRVFKENSSPLVITVRNFQSPPIKFNNIMVAAQLNYTNLNSHNHAA